MGTILTVSLFSYENFVSSRGKHFDKGYLVDEMMKATLA